MIETFQSLCYATNTFFYQTKPTYKFIVPFLDSRIFYQFFFLERNREKSSKSVNEIFKEVKKDDGKKEKRKEEEKIKRSKENKRNDEKRSNKSRTKDADPSQKEKTRRKREDTWEIPPEKSKPMIRQDTINLDRSKLSRG